MNLDKQILEELEKFKLMSSYSPKKTLSENINEQNTYNTAFTPNPLAANKKPTETTKTETKTFSVGDVIKDLRSGALGPFNTGAGTTLKDIISGIDKIKDGTQFNQVDAEMAKNPVNGYTSIVKLLQGEIDGADVMAIQTIKNSLNKKGINLNYKSKEGSGEVDPNSIQIQSVKSTKPATKPAPIPKELGNIEGVKKFQDWLDKNHAGWATGFSGGILNKAGGYGRFGPRTSKGWASYGAEYQKSLTGTPPPTNPNDVASLENKFGLKSSADIVADYKKNNANIPNPNGVNPQDMAKNS
jgi:hypothetical protein